MSSVSRILVWFKKGQDKVLKKANFTDSILNVLCGSDAPNTGSVYVSLQEDKVIVSDSPSKEADEKVKLTRPSFCPIHNLQAEQMNKLPDDVKTRGIDCGVVVLLEASDGKLLLTRRAKHLHTFPGIWVPPGGHIESGETFLQTALRELQEETGLELQEEWCLNKSIKLLALWESVYPPKLSVGLPKRHHLVIYVHAKLTSSYTSDKLQQSVKLDPGEVGASAWIDKKIAKGIVLSMDGEDNFSAQELRKQMPDTLSIAVVSPASPEPKTELINPAVFLNVALSEAKDCERVSTGTKYALAEWLKLTA